MKFFAGILITISLTLGALSAATAYIPKLASISAEDGLTLNAPAGRSPDDSETPMFDPADGDIVLDAAHLEALAAGGIERVRVKEFAVLRWDGRWLFALSRLGLIVGAGLVRAAATRDLAAAQGIVRAPTETPDHALQAARDEVQQLIDARDAAPDAAARGHHIAEVLDQIRSTHQEAVAGATVELTSRLGAAGYAQLMDRFASAERQLHRAWSAAVDGAMEEAEICLVRSVEWLDAAKARLEA